MQETQVRFLGWEDSLEKEMTTHSSILAWRIHGQRSLAGYTVHGVTRVGHDLLTKPPPQNILLLLAADKFASFLSSGSTTLIFRVLSACVGRASLFHGKETPQGRCFEQKVCSVVVAQQTLFGWVDGSCSGIYCS